MDYNTTNGGSSFGVRWVSELVNALSGNSEHPSQSNRAQGFSVAINQISQWESSDHIYSAFPLAMPIPADPPLSLLRIQFSLA